MVTVLVALTMLSAVVASGLLLFAWWRSNEVEGPVVRDLAGSGVVVVAVHSVRGGEGPGNSLVEPAASGDVLTEVRVQVGDPIVVGGIRYRVTGTEVREKASTADDETIWRGRDGLVVVTCFLDASVALSDQPNLVVRAERWGSVN